MGTADNGEDTEGAVWTGEIMWEWMEACVSGRPAECNP